MSASSPPETLTKRARIFGSFSLFSAPPIGTMWPRVSPSGTRLGLMASASERRLDARRERAHVGAALDLRLQHAHDLAHVLHGRGAGRGDGVADERVELGAVELGGEVAGEQGDLGGFLRHEIGAVAGLELGDGFLALLDHLVDDREHLRIVELNALVDLALLDARLEHANTGKAVS